MYKTISLPIEFVEKYIDPLIDDKSLGYSSRPNVIKEAVKKLYDELKGENKEK